MKIYVASSFGNIPEVEAVMGVLKGLGHTITHDWTKERVQPGWSEEETTAYLATCGANDARGVRECDVLVLVNHDKCRDSMTEFGMALGLGKPAIVLFPGRRSSVFFREPGVRMANQFHELFADLKDLADKVAA